ncbi:MobA/MobL family protein [Novosphingobium sp. PY1]|uniref:MobA/MobL protein domain-containing protein n=1 Tax=Ochrobactrum sp. PW1 TaxID=1882222 RepID=A0A292GMI0_9HYPH|nr:MobA/MobL family protein [Novosphingobium sp. PY1]BBA74303.1 hypothetical protein [Ochrobactrum sp. PW1]GFM29152.1 uncharacterized protein PY1_contig-07-78 [Novosphingobium sp. PY1]
MAKTSISADVAAANSKLAQFLRRKEEEEMLLQIGKRKPKQQRDEKRLLGGRARWAAEPDFRVPTCLVDRPRTASGSTSFHFSYISISKEAVPTIGGKPLPGSFGKLKEPALEHSKYIERDGAAELTGVSASAHHAGYIERPGAVEMLDPFGLVEEEIERKIASVVNETPTAEEASILGLREAAPEGIPSVFSNISNDPFERQEFWRAVERCERKPRTHHIILDPEASPRWWDAMLASNDIATGFKVHTLNVAEALRQHVKTPSNNDAATKPFEAEPYPVSAERAGKLIQQAMLVPGFDHSLPPLQFKSGRGGRVQIRFVAELPHEISAEDRALIVQNFVDRLGRLETRIDDDLIPQKVGMMYTAVIHAPDAHNDSRNYHLHIVAYDRPATFRHDLGMWDFEFAEHYFESRKMRTRFPFRQNKIGEVSQHGSRTGKENSGKDFIPAMRKDFADIVNKVLKARGIERRYDHRRYTEMGIDRTPTEHLGTKAAALEAIGVPTTVGQLNAIAIWSDAERSIERQAEQREAKWKRGQRSLRSIEDRASYYDYGNPLIPQLRTLITERRAIIKDLAEDRRSIMVFDTMEAKAKSRAMRTRQTCVRLLADIENGEADGTTRVMKFAIEARWKDAQKHIETIDAALAPHRSALAEAAADIERRERRLMEIDAAIRPIETKLAKVIREIERDPSRPRHDPADLINELAAQPFNSPTPVNAQKASESEQVDPQARARQDKSMLEPSAETDAHKQAPRAAAHPHEVARGAHAQDGSVTKKLEAQTAINAEKQMPAIEPVQADKQKEPSLTERQSSASNSDKLVDKKAKAPQPSEQANSISAERSEPGTREAIVPRDEAAPAFEGNNLRAQKPADEISSGLQSPRTVPEPPEIASAASEHEAKKASVPLKPITLDGVPIVKGTIEPNVIGEDHTTLADQQKTPEGLSPLRKEEQTSQPDGEGMTFSADVGNEDRTRPPNLPNADQSTAETAPEVDRRRKIEDPLLLELESQEAPAKPGTSMAELEMWEALIGRIQRDRIPIKIERTRAGQQHYLVPSLDPSEQALLRAKRFGHRTHARLERIHDLQRHEINRLGRWIQEHGKDPQKLKISETGIIIQNVPLAIKTLFENWYRHPQIRELFTAENNRRLAIARQRAEAAKPAPERFDIGFGATREQALDEVRFKYPAPDQVYTEEVSEFTRLLRDLAPMSELKKAADRIAANPYAREDVNHHAVALATAYERVTNTTLDSGYLHQRRGMER